MASSSKLSGSTRGQSDLNFVFFRKPESFFSSENGGPLVGGVRLEKTSLKYGEFGKSVAVGTGEFEEIKCGLVLKSIGYKSVPLDGLPFDYFHGIVPNIKGRVIRSVYENPTDVVDGLYVSGWLKRGPSGIIATNMYCAEETGESVMEDIGGCVGNGGRKAGRDGLRRLVDSRGGRVVPFGGWEKIEEEEKRVGILKGKPREKITSICSLLKISS